jgi:atypical dual specificity phosphatase
MWTWSLNWNEITPQIVVGTCPMTADDLSRIERETGASAVMSVQHDECLAYWGIRFAQLRRRATELGLTLIRCPIRDFDIPDMRRQLPRAISTLASLQNRGLRTYVHCTAGMGRSPLVVLGFLTLVEGLHPEAAIALILAGRPQAVPAWEAYHGCRHDLVSQHRQAIEARAYGLYRQGVTGSAEADWHRAETEVLREALLGSVEA